MISTFVLCAITSIEIDDMLNNILYYLNVIAIVKILEYMVIEFYAFLFETCRLHIISYCEIKLSFYRSLNHQ